MYRKNINNQRESTKLKKYLSESHPEIAKQWHPEKNGELTPCDVNAASKQKVWWKCPKGDDHEWPAVVCNRTGKKSTGCAVCSNKKVVKSNCLATTHPEIAAQWHPDKNGELTPYVVNAGRELNVWWKCPKGDDHEWEALISSRAGKKPTGCSICSNKKVVKSNCLATTHPEIAAQWHPEKNGGLTPYNVTRGSSKNIWWKCPKGDDHEWQATVTQRTKTDNNCSVCKNLKVTPSNCLTVTHPEIAAQWHPTKNAISPSEVTIRTTASIWWKCPKGDDHEWPATIGHRTGKRRTGCPVCRNLKVVHSNCLAVTHPEIAAEWHPEKNGELTPYTISAGSELKVWWKCLKGDDHEWPTSASKRTQNNSSCPVCINQKVVKSNCLVSTHPEIAAQWHPTNNIKSPYEVSCGYTKLVWWKCQKGDDHEWPASVYQRTKIGTGCPVCKNLRVAPSNSLAVIHPKIAAEWHPEKNGDLTPYNVTRGSSKNIWWKCPKGDDHEWEATIGQRTGKRKTGCPVCRNLKVVHSNCLAVTHPEIAAEWHPEKNGELTPYVVNAGRELKVWWKCAKGDDHEWPASVYQRTKIGTGCPVCNLRWTIENIKLFIKSLLPNIPFLTPPELYVIFQQNGLVNFNSKSGSLIKAIRTGKFPQEELEKFVNGQESIVDLILKSDQKSTNPPEFIKLEESLSEKNLLEESEELPVIETKDILSALDNKIISNIDQEAVEFFINSAIAKIWRHAFVSEETVLEQLNTYTSGEYSSEVKNKFLLQYNGAKKLLIPEGYNFSSDTEIMLPNLMQRYTAFLIKENKRIGNWSGTGAGKTLSAVLSSRVINARLTLVCCPNNVIDGWKNAIMEIFPDSVIFTKTLAVHLEKNRSNYLILNYEFFQQQKAESLLKKFIAENNIDFVVIDEIHYSKQRVVENISKRRKVIAAMLSEIEFKNNNLHVLGMSATPVINNLFEGKTLIELITGVRHDDINTVATISNCISLYQKMVVHGIRWMPSYRQKLHVETINVDCSEWIDEIRQVSNNGTMVDLEAVLTKARFPVILKNIKHKTIVYTHFLKNIIEPLQEYITENGWKVSVYSGDDKSGLNSFLYGNVDVLIATSCLSTGVDGLQKICNRVIINTLPWTNAEFEQLKGRVYRQGQKKEFVDIIVPLTFAVINNERWSWCDSKWRRIQFKKSIADAAVDGVIPDDNLRSPAQAYQDAINWLKRLDEGQLNEIQREKITLTLSNDDIKIGFRKYGDFSNMNRVINLTSSSSMHEKFKKNPDYWEYYHSLYREARKEWSVVPYKEAIKWCKARPHLIIGDFGCGEALLAKEVENKIYSFDHIAIDDNVISCDISNVPLEDECLDAAIFSLALMGSNYLDYIEEAYRCLKLDGHLWIAEATSRYQNLLLEDKISQMGFDIRRVFEKSNFTFLTAIKNET